MTRIKYRMYVHCNIEMISFWCNLTIYGIKRIMQLSEFAWTINLLFTIKQFQSFPPFYTL